MKCKYCKRELKTEKSKLKACGVVCEKKYRVITKQGLDYFFNKKC